ncbi:MAG: GvpL/GvpF family gas vesicle protein [Sphingomonadales bacterium]|nr:GvpL/GvpF family gas vesicle protein [Sphingomonadales bacterium]
MTGRTGSRGEGLYLYAIIETAGLSDDWAAAGSDGVHIVQHGRFAALVRHTDEGPPAGHDREELAARLMAHQNMIERAMAIAPVLPVKFGTVAPDGQSVVRSLKAGSPAFATAFQSMDGMVQFEVLATWDLETVFAEIATEPAIREVKERLNGMANGLAHEESVHLGSLVKTSLERRRTRLGKNLLASMRTVSADLVANPLMDDKMVLNLALLVRADRADVLDDCIETLDAAHGGQLASRRVGPLPPHSFATVEIVFLDTASICRARGVLGVDADADAKAALTAYRRLAKSVHPDLAGNRAGSERIRTLIEAYETLSAFAKADGPVAVSVRRQEPAYGAGMV